MHFRTRSGVDGRHAEHGRRVGPAGLRHAGRRRPRERCGQEFDTVRVADANGTREIPTPDDLPLAARRSAARRSAHHRLRQPARVRHRDRRRTRGCARRSATSSKAARFPTIRRPRPSPTASPACRCSTRSAAPPASAPGSTIYPSRLADTTRDCDQPTSIDSNALIAVSAELARASATGRCSGSAARGTRRASRPRPRRTAPGARRRRPTLATRA